MFEEDNEVFDESEIDNDCPEVDISEDYTYEGDEGYVEGPEVPIEDDDIETEGPEIEI